MSHELLYNNTIKICIAWTNRSKVIMVLKDIENHYEENTVHASEGKG